MPKWKRCLAEAAPIAIGVVFLLAVAFKPHISLIPAAPTWGAILKEHFWKELSFQPNIQKLLERLSHKDLKKAARHTYPAVPHPVPDDTPRTRIKTAITLHINALDEIPVEKTDWQTQLNALKEHGGRLSVTYEMLEAPPPC